MYRMRVGLGFDHRGEGGRVGLFRNLNLVGRIFEILSHTKGWRWLGYRVGKAVEGRTPQASRKIMQHEQQRLARGAW